MSRRSNTENHNVKNFAIDLSNKNKPFGYLIRMYNPVTNEKISIIDEDTVVFEADLAEKEKRTIKLKDKPVLTITSDECYISFKDEKKTYHLYLIDEQIKNILRENIDDDNKICGTDSFFGIYIIIKNAIKKSLIVQKPDLNDDIVEIKLTNNYNYPCIRYNKKNHTSTYYDFNGFPRTGAKLVDQPCNDAGECTFNKNGTVTVSYLTGKGEVKKKQRFLNKRSNTVMIFMKYSRK